MNSRVYFVVSMLVVLGYWPAIKQLDETTE